MTLSVPSVPDPLLRTGSLRSSWRRTVETVSFCHSSGSYARSYEAHRDLLTAVDNTVDTARISRYSYANNAIGKRMHAINEGLAVAMRKH